MPSDNLIWIKKSIIIVCYCFILDAGCSELLLELLVHTFSFYRMTSLFSWKVSEHKNTSQEVTIGGRKRWSQVAIRHDHKKWPKVTSVTWIMVTMTSASGHWSPESPVTDWAYISVRTNFILLQQNGRCCVALSIADTVGHWRI